MSGDNDGRGKERHGEHKDAGHLSEGDSPATRTLAGRHFHQRMGCSILNALGRPQWVADDEKTYIEIAAGLAADTSLLTGIRQGLRLEMQSSPLLDATHFTAGLECQYRQMLAPAASAGKPYPSRSRHP